MAVTPTATFNEKYASFTATTAGAFISGPIPVNRFVWLLTSTVTSTMSLQIAESTAVHGTTETRTIIGPVWATTNCTRYEFPIGHWCNSVWLDTITGGTLHLIPAPRHGTGYIF